MAKSTQKALLKKGKEGKEELSYCHPFTWQVNEGSKKNKRKRRGKLK